MPSALITGASGQDAAFLSKILLARGYTVHLTEDWRTLTSDYWRLSRLDILDRVNLHACGLERRDALRAVLHDTKPDEVYHLASYSSPAGSCEDVDVCVESNIAGTLNLFSVLVDNPAKLFFASSSEVFSTQCIGPQSEHFPLGPTNPYGISKVVGQMFLDFFQRRHGLYWCYATMFNHTSELASERFVVRKIVKGLLKFFDSRTKLKLGNLEAKRDIGFAQDYMDAAWRMLNLIGPVNLVLATGNLYTVGDIVQIALGLYNMKLQTLHTVEEVVEVDKSLVVPDREHPLIGDYSRAQNLGILTHTHTFVQLINRMVTAELDNYAHPA